MILGFSAFPREKVQSRLNASQRHLCHMPNQNQEATIRQRVQNPARMTRTPSKTMANGRNGVKKTSMRPSTQNTIQPRTNAPTKLVRKSSVAARRSWLKLADRSSIDGQVGRTSQGERGCSRGRAMA